MTEVERAEARAAEPQIGRELVQSFVLMGFLALTVVVLLGLTLLAGRLLG